MVSKEDTHDGVAVEKSPDAAEDGQKDAIPLATIGELFSFAESSKTKLYLALGIFFAMIAGCALPASLFYFSDVLGDISALQSEGLDPVIEVVYVMMVLGVISLISETFLSAFLETAAYDMTMNLKRKWFEAVIRQDMAYFDINDVSGTATIISTNGARFKKGVGKKLGSGIQFSCTVIAGFALAFYASWRVTLVTLATVPIMAGSTGWVLRINQNKTSRDNAAYAKAGSIVYQAASSIRTILALNAGSELIDRFNSATETAYDGAVGQLLNLGIANGALMSSFMLAYVVVVGYGSFLLYDEVRENGCDPSGAISGNPSCTPSGGDIFLALMGVIFAGATIPQVSTALEAITGARSACYPALLAISRVSATGEDAADRENVKRYEAILARGGGDKALPKYEIDYTSALGKKPSSVTGTIEFHDVSFHYPTRKEAQVFNGFNLKIEAGKTVALVGPSGSGKSTTVQLIERFYDPTFGMVTLDGVDLRALNVSWLRQQIGLVSQEPALFATTIKENIKIAKPDATDEEIENAARRANAHDFISTLQDGYDTHVGDRGAQLSGGQKQRIAIARTLITDPKIILLDEATSALDSESEAVVQEALDVIMQAGNATVVVIAHRLSTIRSADMIAVVDQGKVAETGTHDELLAKKGKYFDLVEAQKGKHLERQDSSTSATTEDTEFSGSNPPSRANSAADLTELETAHGDGHEVVNVRNVHFTYPSRPDNKIFRGLGLEVKEGETLAIVGPSGQGKSTVIQLLEEFYRPSKGTVKYNGDDIKELNVRWYRNEIGLVSQEPTLFDGSISENIKFGMPEATQAEIEEAAKKANAHNFIMEFPDGYDTQVGSVASSQISGGQKQRVAIARALLRKPKVLLLDEATSALDTESEKVVQAALDEIMKDSKLITVVIAHRLSTIRGADKIAFVDQGKVREIGTYEELMAKPNGHYKRLEALQTLGEGEARADILSKKTVYASTKPEGQDGDDKKKRSSSKSNEKEIEAEEIDAETAKANEKKARDLAKEEYGLFIWGSIGAFINGLTFPGQGFVFAFLIELFYQFTLPCNSDEDAVEIGEQLGKSFSTCQEYWDSTAQDMQDLSFKTLYWLVGLIACTMAGNIIMFQGFGTATERINKRVRDKTFEALIRQEVAWYDVRSVGEITSQLSDDAALIHSFSGEPIRTAVMSLSSVGAGLIVSFVFLWEFAFVALGILPFMAFGEYMQTAQIMGEDEGDTEKTASESSEGSIVVETLVNIRIVDSLCMETNRIAKYMHALDLKARKYTLSRNTIAGSGQGMGSFFQMWGYALMFYFGSWLLLNRDYEIRDYFVSLFGLMLSLTGLATALSGLTDAEKAKAAAQRIFELTERVSEIDPLSDEGKMQS